MPVQTVQIHNSTPTNFSLWSNAYNTTYDVGVFVYNRVPNQHEVLEVTAPYAVLLVISGAIPYKLDGHPTSKAVFRDAIKLPSIVIAAYHGIEIGSTGIFYDVGNVIGSVLKTACKVTALGGSTYFYPALLTGPVGWFTLVNIALTANFVCEVPARTFKVTSYKFQTICKHNTTCTLSYGEFMWDNAGDLLLEGTKQSIPKTFTSDILVGSTLKPLFHYIITYANLASGFLTTQMCLLITGKDPNLYDQLGIYNKAATCIAAGAGVEFTATAVTYAAFGVIEMAIATVRETIASILFIPVVNAVADGPIPGWIFGSQFEFTTTAIGGSATAVCIATTPLTLPICIAGGIAVKAAADFALSDYNEALDTTETPLIGGEAHEEL